MATTLVGAVSDLLTHSPDGETRGLLARVGDLFPLDPADDLCAGRHEPASGVRPWGLRFLRDPQPQVGKHGGKTQATTGGGVDGQNPEDWTKD